MQLRFSFELAKMIYSGCHYKQFQKKDILKRVTSRGFRTLIELGQFHSYTIFLQARSPSQLQEAQKYRNRFKSFFNINEGPMQKEGIPISSTTMLKGIGGSNDDDLLDSLTKQLANKIKRTENLALCRRSSETTVVTEFLEDTTICQVNDPITTALGFPNVTSKSDLLIDWTSRKSHKTRNKLFKKISNGHSEGQFINDINDIWRKCSTSVVKLLIPPTEKIDSAEVMMCGVNLYGPFDMCDQCLEKLVQFRAQHQQGQESISQAVRDELKTQFQGDDTDAFVVTYNSLYPYKYSTYYGKSKASTYELDYSISYSWPRTDIFSYNGKAMDDTFTLSQSSDQPVSKGKIYSHIQLLADRKVPYENKSKSFTFY
eukprot:gene3415-6777_t